MTISTSTLLTAGLLAGLILAGSLVPVHAGDGCDKGRQGSRTDSLWVLEKCADGFATIRRACEDPVVNAMVAAGLPLGGERGHQQPAR